MIEVIDFKGHRWELWDIQERVLKGEKYPSGKIAEITEYWFTTKGTSPLDSYPVIPVPIFEEWWDLEPDPYLGMYPEKKCRHGISVEEICPECHLNWLNAEVEDV